MSETILNPCYFAPIAWYDYYRTSSRVYLEVNGHYQKRRLINAALIATSQGLKQLSIPLLKGKNQQLPLNEVKISYAENWRKKHWLTIQSAYGRAPYFEHFQSTVKSSLLADHEYLLSMLFSCHEIVCDIMNWTNHHEQKTDAYLASYPSSVLDMRSNPPSEWKTNLLYAQVFEDRHGFLDGLSILDFIFCLGPHGINQRLNSTSQPNIDQ